MRTFKIYVSCILQKNWKLDLIKGKGPAEPQEQWVLSRGLLLFSHLFSVAASIIPSRYRPASTSALRVFILEILNSCSCHSINLGKALIGQAVNTPESILIRKMDDTRQKQGCWRPEDSLMPGRSSSCGHHNVPQWLFPRYPSFSLHFLKNKQTSTTKSQTPNQTNKLNTHQPHTVN